MPTATLTRRQLYDLVWQMPMRQIGENYGVSAGRIAKLCERHAVPIPSPGHWPLTRKGYVMEREALPTEPAESTRIEIVPEAPPEREEHPIVAKQIAFEKEHPI